MSYTKTVWRNNQAPAINADNLNHIEQGIESAHNQMAINTSDIGALTTQVQGNANNIASEISARQTTDSSLQLQIDQLVAPTGEAPNPAEIENARIGDNQVIYDTLGNAIRGQFADVKNTINSIYEKTGVGVVVVDDNSDFVNKNQCYNADGTTATYTNWNTTDYIPCHGYSKVYFRLVGFKHPSSGITLATIAFFDESKEFVSSIVIDRDAPVGALFVSTEDIPASAYYLKALGYSPVVADPYVELLPNVRANNLQGQINTIVESQTYALPKELSELETDYGHYYRYNDGARIEFNQVNAVKVNLHYFDILTVYTDNLQTLVFFDENGGYIQGFDDGTNPSFSLHSYVVDDPRISYAWVNVTISTQATYKITLNTMFYDAYEADRNVYNSVYKDSTLFDAVLVPENISLPNNGWITTDGVIHSQPSSGSWQYSNKQPSYEGQKIEYYVYGQTDVGVIIFFDADDEVLSYITYVPTGSEITGEIQGTTFAPADVAYFRACSYMPRLSNWYIKAYDKTNLPYTLNALANKTTPSPWEGKTINCLGDSITYGAFLDSPTTQRWSTILASLTGATVNNYGVSGSKISDISGDSTPSFIDRYQSMVDADLVIVFGGTNDYWHGATDIGTMGSTDVSTFYGALSTILSYLVAKSPLTQVIFIFPYQQKYGNSNTRVNNGHGTFEDFRNAAKIMCEYYSVPMLDFFDKSGFDVIDSSVQYSALTVDGVHPNVAGHNYIARRIKNFINDIEPLI